ncbi:MAG: glycosyltransferase [Halieaceae bacterium]|jgi:GT2 family glycosyltransferase|nr:glycosyltransferase [Halieaceae bacterium]
MAGNTAGNYAVAVICYYPEREALATLCTRLQGGGVLRCLIDNGSDEAAELDRLAAESGFELIAQDGNLGIAEAVNRWVASLPESIEAFALFDQDSLPEAGYCDRLWEKLQQARVSGDTVAAIGGQVFDAPEHLPLKFVRLGRLRVHELDPSGADVAPDYLIISGTLYDRRIFRESGGFDAALFVDNVDLEWSYRVTACGAQLRGTADMALAHRIGDDCLRVPGLNRGLKVHSPQRLRLMSRSRVLSYRRPSVPLRWKYHDALRFLAKSLLLLILHPQRVPMARQIGRGIVDGLRPMPAGPSASALSRRLRGGEEPPDYSLGARIQRRLKRSLNSTIWNKLRRRFMGLHKLRHTRSRKVALFDFLREQTPLHFDAPERPTVSIVLILYNRAELTLACLHSLHEHMDVAYELIIIDNASEDESSLMLDLVEGATIVRNEDNRGFLLACNQAAELARGELLLLLNNDSELGDGGISAAVNTLKQSEDIGAVGAKILLLDGRLQEAGSIQWSDGSCLGYGRDMDPADPRGHFQRDVDYCSGAFLLTPLALFRSLGGFDERFAPAYYEETDYCARLWQAGYRVVYEPGTQITHFEFASSSTGSTAAMQQMERNQEIFRAKHADYLATRLAPLPENILRARHHHHDAPRVLYIDDRVPHQYQGSGFPRSNDVVNVLADSGALVTVLPYNFPYEDPVFAPRTDIPAGVEVMSGYGRHNITEFLAEREGFFDAVWVSRPHNMLHFRAYLESPALENAAVIYDAEAFFAWRDIRKAAVKGRPLAEDEQEALLKKEGELLCHADHVVTVTETEGAGFIEHGDLSAEDLTIVGHSLAAVSEAPDFASRRDFMFVGNLDYCDAPNADSVLWFVRDVWPQLRAKLPEACFHVVGSNHCDAVRNLSVPGVTLHGRVEDLRDLYDRCRVFLAPTRYAAGIPYKIHDAAAAGVPVVASELVAQQVGWKDTPALSSAPVEDPAAFAAACARLYVDETLWLAQQLAAHERLREDCDPQHFAQQVIHALERARAKHAQRGTAEKDHALAGAA